SSADFAAITGAGACTAASSASIPLMRGLGRVRKRRFIEPGHTIPVRDERSPAAPGIWKWMRVRDGGAGAAWRQMPAAQRFAAEAAWLREHPRGCDSTD